MVTTSTQNKQNSSYHIHVDTAMDSPRTLCDKEVVLKLTGLWCTVHCWTIATTDGGLDILHQWWTTGRPRAACGPPFFSP